MPRRRSSPGPAAARRQHLGGAGGGQHFVRICIWRMDTFTPGTFTAMTSTSTELSMEPLVFLS